MKKEKNEEMNIGSWDSIVAECERVYPNQKNPKHYASLIKWCLGGNGPLDGVSVYDGGDYWHFVTFGLSELYEKETDNKDISGYGMEFTFKLKKDNYKDEELELQVICSILQSIARITFTKGEIFRAYEFLYTGQKEGIDASRESNITGFITIPDNNFRSIDSPNGRIDFIEFIGATDSELLAIQNGKLNVKSLYAKIGSDITDYRRETVI